MLLTLTNPLCPSPFSHGAWPPVAVLLRDGPSPGVRTPDALGRGSQGFGVASPVGRSQRWSCVGRRPALEAEGSSGNDKPANAKAPSCKRPPKAFCWFAARRLLAVADGGDGPTGLPDSGTVSREESLLKFRLTTHWSRGTVIGSRRWESWRWSSSALPRMVESCGTGGSSLASRGDTASAADRKQRFMFCSSGQRGRPLRIPMCGMWALSLIERVAYECAIVGMNELPLICHSLLASSQR